MHEAFEVEGHPGDVQHRLVAGVEVLVLGPERDEQRAACVPVEPASTDQAEARAGEDVQRLFAVAMPSAVPADRYLALEHVAAHSRVPELAGDHQLGPDVLGGAHPGNILIARYRRRRPKCPGELIRALQPAIIKGLCHVGSAFRRNVCCVHYCNLEPQGTTVRAPGAFEWDRIRGDKILFPARTERDILFA